MCTAPMSPDAGESADLVGQVIEIWRSVLGQVEIEPDSNLLDLGATSLTAVRIRARIRAELGRDVDLIDFLEYPTPRQLASVVVTSEKWDAPKPRFGLNR